MTARGRLSYVSNVCMIDVSRVLIHHDINHHIGYPSEVNELLYGNLGQVPYEALFVFMGFDYVLPSSICAHIVSF